MRLTRASSYALHALVYMAGEKHNRPIPSHLVARDRGENIPAVKGRRNGRPPVPRLGQPAPAAGHRFAYCTNFWMGQTLIHARAHETLSQDV